jgi:hypothetical protein
MLRSMLRALACFVPLLGDRRMHVLVSAALSLVIVGGPVLVLGSCTNGATAMCGGDAGCGPNLDGAMLDGLFDAAPETAPPFDSPADVPADVADAPLDVHVDVAPDVQGDATKD